MNILDKIRDLKEMVNIESNRGTVILELRSNKSGTRKVHLILSNNTTEVSTYDYNSQHEALSIKYYHNDDISITRGRSEGEPLYGLRQFSSGNRCIHIGWSTIRKFSPDKII